MSRTLHAVLFERRDVRALCCRAVEVVLNARGLSALESLDPTLMAKAQEIGMAVKELHIVPDNKTVAKVPTYGTCIMRDQTAHLLLEAAEAQENISFYWEHKLSSIDFQTKTCTFELPDGSLSAPAA